MLKESLLKKAAVLLIAQERTAVMTGAAVPVVPVTIPIFAQQMHALPVHVPILMSQMGLHAVLDVAVQEYATQLLEIQDMSLVAGQVLPV